MFFTFYSVLVEHDGAEQMGSALPTPSGTTNSPESASSADANALPNTTGLSPHLPKTLSHSSALAVERVLSPDVYIQAFSHAPTGMALLKLSTGRFVYVNPSMCKVLGYSAKELLYLPLATISHPDDAHTEQTWLDAAKTESSDLTISYNKRLITKEEYILWVYIHGTVRCANPTIDDDDIVAVYASPSGVAAEKQLSADRAIFGGLLDIAPDAFVVIDEHHRIVRFNKGAETIFGYTKNEILGRHLDMLIPHQHRNVHRNHIKSFHLGAEQSRMMGDRTCVQGLRKNGEIFDAEASIARLHTDNTSYFSIILRDSTARNRAEEELRIAKEQAETANHTKDTFLGIAAHDIKNPLSNIQTIASLLQQESNTPQTTQEYVSFIQTEAAHAFAIVSNLLNLNALDAGAVHYTLERIDLRLPVASTVRNYKMRAAQKNITLHCSTPDNDHPVPVALDYNAIVQVLDNLVSNAIKFTPQGSNVYITLSVHNRTARISIRDEGPGISEQDKLRLFQRFARLSAQPTGGERSTGLGLSIAKHIIGLLHGSLWCESTTGKGATFFVELPLVQENTAVQ